MKHIHHQPMPSSEEFLDLLSDPVVFAAKVRDFREAIETLNARIDVATTLDEAQRLKWQAQSQRDEFTERQRVHAVEHAAQQQDHARRDAELDQREAAYGQRLQELMRSKREHETLVANMKSDLDARHAEMVKAAAIVTTREQAVLALEAAIQQEQQNWKEKVAQLSAILESS